MESDHGAFPEEGGEMSCCSVNPRLPLPRWSPGLGLPPQTATHGRPLILQGGESAVLKANTGWVVSSKRTDGVLPVTGGSPSKGRLREASLRAAEKPRCLGKMSTKTKTHSARPLHLVPKH